MDNRQLIDTLNRKKVLAAAEWLQLIKTFTPEDREYAGDLARQISIDIFGKKIFFRGIIEFTNICRNDCIYCGIRKSNGNVSRYRLTAEDILECCREGYQLGYRTFVLQGGEDGWFTDERLVHIIHQIRQTYPECAITLSIGERERDSYERLFDAGAERYLLRHETADEEHYGKLHPSSLSWQHRMNCLRDLRDIGYQTGCGMMIGSPYQEAQHIVKDMLFIHDFKPHMIGIGPFIPHEDTPFRNFPAGSTELTLFILSLCRIMQPHVLLPSTTALGSLQGDGRQLGVLAGCNVIMPNLSPLSVRKKYMLYSHKAGMEDDARSGLNKLMAQMRDIGYEIVVGRGDYKL
jgi:biotin synthase